MIQYLLKRLLLFLPTLLVISLLSFALSKIAPGDPVELKRRGGLGNLEGQSSDLRYDDRIYEETAAQLGLDKPPFYFSVAAAAHPDTLYRVLKPERRRTLRRLTDQYGNWPLIQEYYNRLPALEFALADLPDTLAPQAANRLKRSIQQLYLTYRDAGVQSLLDQAAEAGRSDTLLQQMIGPKVEGLQAAYQRVLDEQNPAARYLPALQWHGFDNQYHHWLTGFLTGDLGVAYTDSRPVADKLREGLYWTLILNGTAILLAFLLAVPLGVWSAVRRHRPFDRVTTVVLFVLYSLPNFWIATLLVIFFTTPEYGMDLFPSMGPGEPGPEASFFERLGIRLSHLTLPVFCLTYGSLAFISRQMRGGMLDVLRRDYIRTARAKGLSERQVIWKHAFRNSLFPVITLLASVLPAMIAGSVAIEWIFNIPGMGTLTLRSILARDWPVVYSVLMLAALLTMAGILLADLLYALVDPRVSFKKSRQ